MHKKCLLCGSTFEAIGHNLYCGKNCQRTSKNNKAREKWNESRLSLIKYPYNYNKVKSCVICGEDFIPDIRHPKQKTCSKKCSQKARYLAHKEEYSKSNKERYNRIKNTKEYKERVRRTAKKWREKNPERAKEIGRKFKQSHREGILSKLRKYELKERICAICGNKFLPDRNHPLAKCCSPRCRNKFWAKMNYEKNKKININKSKRYRERHPEKIKEYTKKLVLTGKANENAKRWRLNNLEKARLQGRLRHIKEREKENKRRNILGLPLIKEGYKAEQELGVILKSLFPRHNIVHNDRTTLPNRLELDFHIPELRLAFEYMGRQHYEEVYAKNRTMFFKNKDGFIKQKERDKMKEIECKKKGIQLIHIKFTEKLTEQLILTKINHLIQTAQKKLQL
jgi:predicted nucleic acid-binding Zn ribbon protein